MQQLKVEIVTGGFWKIAVCDYKPEYLKALSEA